MSKIEAIYNNLNPFTFMRMPKTLFSGAFKLSLDAKVLYSFLLDRISLSIQNGWSNDDDRVFVVFTIEEAMKTLECSKGTAIKAFAELDNNKGIGLIERVKRGQGRADIIYVNAIIEESEAIEENEAVVIMDCPVDYENEQAMNSYEYDFYTDEHEAKDNIEYLRSPIIEPHDSAGIYFIPHTQAVSYQESKNWLARSPKFEPLEVHELAPINTNINKTDNIKTSYLNPIYQKEVDISSSKPSTVKELSILSKEGFSVTSFQVENIKTTTAQKLLEIRNTLYENFGMKFLCEQYTSGAVNNLFEIAVSASASSKLYQRIGGEMIPTSEVRKRLMSLDFTDIEYVLECFSRTTSNIRNIRAYLLTALYNAPTTNDAYYSALVRHDMTRLASSN